MNIIYKLENKQKQKFYIGQKVECRVEKTNRYFHKFIRKHIEINDFNGILKE